ncbi:MAG: SUMF1/EgtB/PvdO family nonheme iron enzyme [Candidatus Krumholzibacteria bacterium]|nr:SUMF1/EgtB/PvdO family nonheme iron enzyme [Candidatus Krumholzibacteria bacterium]
MIRISLVLLCCLLLVGSALANTPPSVTNVVATQRAHTALIDLTFDIADIDGDAVHVSLWYSLDAGASWDQECMTVTGDVGLGVIATSGLSAVWDAGVDFPDFINTEFSVRVYADDGSGTIPLGSVVIPPVSVAMPTTFTMGSEVGVNTDPHTVTLTNRFSVPATSVTNAQYVEVLQWAYDQGHVGATVGSVFDALDGSTVELFDLDWSLCRISFSDGIFSTTDPDQPVIRVSWYSSVAYCDWLSLQAGLPRAYDHSTWICNGGNPYSALGYRLPTEAEWEFACRAGTTTEFYTGDCLDANTEANYNGDYPYEDCPAGAYLASVMDVASYPANDWGLFDMHGNLEEWTNDWFGFYPFAVETDPVGPETGVIRVLRGGNWSSGGYYNRSASRQFLNPAVVSSVAGFRPVITVQ